VSDREAEPVRWIPLATIVLVGAVLVAVLLLFFAQGPITFHYSGPILARYSTGAKVASVPSSDSIHKIRHVVIIMQENRSFDDYFGTFPGVNGIPMKNGKPLVCVPDPRSGHCQAPYHDPQVVNGGGPQVKRAGVADIAGGRMDGFVAQAEQQPAACGHSRLDNPACRQLPTVDVMGYHDAREIPNYWAYADDFVLQDEMYQPDLSWGQPAHLFMVSGWSAGCFGRPERCVNNDKAPAQLEVTHGRTGSSDWGWTDITYLLHKHGVSWRYYVGARQSNCNGCSPSSPKAGTLAPSNPLPEFETVKQDGQLGNIQPVQRFRTAASAGHLPAVSWVVPNDYDSERPPASVSVGESYVTGLINAIMRGPDWSSTAIFLSWDNGGGFYDNAVPPTVDQNGYGLRVPGLVISPYARRGYVDHQVFSQDAYLKFIEDDFLGGQRLDPANDGRPDGRPTVRENVPILGNLMADFDFAQAPRPPVLLPVNPAPGSAPGVLRSHLVVAPRQPLGSPPQLHISVGCNEVCAVTVRPSLVLPAGHQVPAAPAPETLLVSSGAPVSLSVSLSRPQASSVRALLARRPTVACRLEIVLDGGAGYTQRVTREASIS
jgi:phospholipase C